MSKEKNRIRKNVVEIDRSNEADARLCGLAVGLTQLSCTSLKSQALLDELIKDNKDRSSGNYIWTVDVWAYTRIHVNISLEQPTLSVVVAQRPLLALLPVIHIQYS